MYKMLLLAGLEIELNSTKLAYIRSGRRLQEWAKQFICTRKKFQENKVISKVSHSSFSNTDKTNKRQANILPFQVRNMP